MVPVNLRPYFGTKTMANFSDGIFVPYDAKTAAYSLERQALILRAKMDLQMQTENFCITIAGKVDAVKNFMASGKDIVSLSRELSSIPPEPDGFTYALTYPGQINFCTPEVKRASVMICVRQSVPFGVFVSAYGDELDITLSHSFDGDFLAREVLRGLKLLGVEAHLSDLGRISCNKMNTAKLLRP